MLSALLVTGGCSSQPTEGPCGSGQTRPCHVVLPGATGDGVLSCISGTQTCGGGEWGACQPDGTIISTSGFQGSVDSNGGIHTLGATPSACPNDPCDPTCQYFSSDDGGVGLTPVDGGGGSYFTGQVPLSALPSGWTKVNVSPCTGPSDCQFDSQCVNGTCTLASPGSKNWCSGIDFTAEAACTEGAKNYDFPICNRGSQDATTGLLSVGFDMNPPPSPVCAPVTGGYPSKGSCVVDLSKTPIKAGSCLDIDPVNLVNVTSCTGVSVSGNRDFFVNYDKKIAECNYCDNEGMKKSGATCQTVSSSAYQTTTFTVNYTATCTAPKVPQWRALAYVATTPSSGGTSSDVKFSAQLGDVGGDGGAINLGTAVTIADTPTGGFPSTCGLFGPSPCPPNLTTDFGGNTLAQRSLLKLTITLTPSSDGLVAPTVSTWQVTYTCEDQQ
ncbi:MAG TPA: hypothetical protein VGH28_07590 [Polyangiaceae bacterium]